MQSVSPAAKNSNSVVVFHDDAAIQPAVSVDGQDRLSDAVYLMSIASVGLTVNALVAASLLTMPAAGGRRRGTASFIIHACLLDSVKCLYCIPFAVSSLQNLHHSVCDALSRSYIVLVTASGFNLIAMICSEAYVFNRSLRTSSGCGLEFGVDGPTSSASSNRSTVGCTLFGLLMVYACSLLIHLGPTIIGGGDFYHRSTVTTDLCVLAHATVKNYVVHVLWIVIMTFAMLLAAIYLSCFDRHVRTTASHHLMSAVCRDGGVSDGVRLRLVRRAVRRTSTTTRTLMIVSVLFIACWYPLHILTIIDPGIQQPFKVYKLLSFIAWSNAVLTPLALLLFDDVLPRCCRRHLHHSRRRPRPWTASTPTPSASMAQTGRRQTSVVAEPSPYSLPDDVNSVCARVGLRLGQT